jgi:hypothetical protein
LDKLLPYEIRERVFVQSFASGRDGSHIQRFKLRKNGMKQFGG